MSRIVLLGTVAAVLRRLGIEPETRMSGMDQNAEYTACRAEEVPLYFDLYSRGELDQAERAVLCCFLLEGLNELTQASTPHPLQDQIIDSLLEEQHDEELAYWMDTSDPDPDNWWPITQALRARAEARRNRAFQPPSSAA